MSSSHESGSLDIALVADRFGARFGGAEAYGVSLAGELVRAGHRVTVYAREYDSGCKLQLPFHRIPVHRIWPSWIRVLLFAIRAARATHKRHDIVHSHMNGWCGDVEVVHVTPVRYRWKVQPASWARRLGYCLSPRVQAYLHLESRRLAMRPGHRVVAVSQLIGHQLVQAYGHVMQGISTIPPGVDPGERVSGAERMSIRNSLGLPEHATLCLLVARNPLRKGLPAAIKALEHLPDHVCLVVVGANAAARERVSKEAESLRSRVFLAAETSHVMPWYQAADIYIHPTLNDSFGMAPLEAMSFGLPVIMSPGPWCGFAQYVEPQKEALVLDHPENAQQLAAFIRRLLDDPGLAHSLRQGSLAVLARHAWPEVARRYMELYSEIITERKRQTGH